MDSAVKVAGKQDDNLAVIEFVWTVLSELRPAEASWSHAGERRMNSDPGPKAS